MKLIVTVWGSRGSIPVSGQAFQRYGGATTCVELSLEGAFGATPARILLDCGSGMAALGKQWGDRAPNALCLQTHMHWDHIQGFPFFGPCYDPASQLDFWSVPREGYSLRDMLGRQMTQPAFPIGLDIMPAQMAFRDLPEQGTSQLGQAEIAWTEVCHPSGSTAYRVTYGGQSVVFSGDVEVQQGSRERLLDFARGCDLLIMDSQYFPEEYPSRQGFGHSTPLDAVALCEEAEIGHLLLTHHDPSHDDTRLDAKLALAQQAASPSLQVGNAYDGLELPLYPTAPLHRAFAAIEQA